MTYGAGTGLIQFVIGLLLLAVAAVWVSIIINKSGLYNKWSGVPLAVGISLNLPQFFANQPLRIAHGALVAVGCFALAYTLWKHTTSKAN